MAGKSKKEVSNEDIFKVLISMDKRITNIEDQLGTMVTKDRIDISLGKVEESLVKEIRALGRAVDKDAVAIFKLEQRLSRVEKQVLSK